MAAFPGLEDAFARRFGRPPELGARAPGRVNLIGEHTDYNDGWVLPCAIDRDTVVLAARRDDGRVRIFSRESDQGCEFDPGQLAREGDWGDYARGVVFALRERGAAVGGLDLAVASQLPPGSGLSSSAALCVVLATAFDRAQGLDLDAVARARVAHRAENGFVGVACGIMDPFACALGRRDHALRLDCRSAEAAQVPLPSGRLAWLVAHSGVERRLARGSYGDRVAECRSAFQAAAAAGLAPPGARALRDLRVDDLPALERRLESVLFRRARHVIRENARVLAFCERLAAAEIEAAGALLRESMASLRDDFEVSLPELDALCEIADALPGVYGSRLTGAGFGGCTLHAVAPEAAEEVASRLMTGFERRAGRRPPVLRVRPSDGAEAFGI
ncbi:MAG TPA: galactokinase [Myxococcota bacterium]|jgi:galactokinase